MEYRPFLHLGVVPIEKGAFGSPLTTVANLTYFILAIGLISRVFANGLENRGSILDRVISKTQKMVLGASYLFNTQHYKVMIKSKV